MQYKELIQFESITTVVKLVNTNELSVAEKLVKTFVFSKKMIDDLNKYSIKEMRLLGFNITSYFEKNLPSDENKQKNLKKLFSVEKTFY